MSALVLGTAGHIDHGKSTLVKALTGTDPDRLAEEKERGITIELGFAELELPSGRRMSVVDVPGHERFVRQMVAGATGIDVVLLVVAADDGVMPQTREHLAIIDLLGISHGVVAITKSDLVDAEWLDLVTAEVQTLTAATSIGGAPVHSVSARTGAGLSELLLAIDRVAADAESAQRKQFDLPLRLPVDRVFTIAGAGTVVTGTLWSGVARLGDTVEVYPGGRRGRIRGVQVHAVPVERAQCGSRVALNIAGLSKEEVARGDTIAAPGSLTVTDRFDARFTYLANEPRPFESGTRVHVHHGTREVLGRVLLMNGAEVLQPGQSAFAQLRLEEPFAPRCGDRFIIRSYSPMSTIGGGVVLDVRPPRRTTLRAHERTLLDALVRGDIGAAACALLEARALPMTACDVADALGVPENAVSEALAGARLDSLMVDGQEYFLTQGSVDALNRTVERELVAFHEANPAATGIGIPALRDRVDRRLEPRVFDSILGQLVRVGEAVVEGGEVRHVRAASHALAAEEEAAVILSDLLAAQGLAPAGLMELASAADVDTGVARKVLGKLAAEGRVVRLGQDLYFDAAAVIRAREILVDYLREHGTILAKDARDLIGTTRKYTLPLLEYFDAQGVTKRSGDARTLGRHGKL